MQIFLNWFARVRDCQIVSRSFCHSSEGLVYHYSKVSVKVTTFCSSGPNVYAYIFSLGSLSIPISFPLHLPLTTNSTKALGCCMAGMVGDPQMVDVVSCFWNFTPFNHRFRMKNWQLNMQNTCFPWASWLYHWWHPPIPWLPGPRPLARRFKDGPGSDRWWKSQVDGWTCCRYVSMNQRIRPEPMPLHSRTCIHTAYRLLTGWHCFTLMHTVCMLWS